VLALFFCGIASGQKAVSKEIQNLKNAGVEFSSVEVLKYLTTDIQNREYNLDGLKRGAILQLDQDAIQSMYQEQQDFISLSVPITNRTNMVLTLKRHEIVTPDFKLLASSDPTNPVAYTPGLHYKGIVEGDPNSLVGLSVYRNQVMAFISDQQGNLEIRLIPGDENLRHVVFNVEDLDQPFVLECNGPEDELDYTTEQLFQSPSSRDLNDCVRLYIELDDELVTAKGGVIPATDYMMGVVNQSIVVFADEQINMVVSEMLAWDGSSPYTYTNATFMMNSFMDNTGFYNGDLAMLVNFTNFTTHSYGSLAGLCNPNPDMSKCVGALNQTSEFSNVVTVCHYFGHLLGSRHTHDCIWNGNNTSIDACFYEGGNSPCPGPDPAYPVNGGTMMSYCSPGHGWFYNLAEGFGPQPGNIIRNTVNQAGNCIFPCGPPSLYCFSNGANAASKFIKKVVLGSISNESGLNYGYGNYISLSTNLNAGTAYSISLTPGHASQTKYWRVWIDYNHDEDWADAGEQVGQGSSSGSGAVPINFTVPTNSPAVSTRMRVSMSYGTFPPICGEFNEGEVEDYTVSISGAPSPTCSDGIQNQGESGIDCGGPCSACPPPPTCSDGIQNQNETGIDCGGTCPACPEGDSTILLASYFETGWDSWIDGGPDAARASTSNAWEGQYAIELADNSGAQSSMTSPIFNLSDAVGLQINFHFKAVSMESGEDFWVQYKNGSGAWTTIGSFVSGSNFTNGNFYSASLTVPNFIPTSAGSLRIQCDASDNNDQIFIDEVTILKLSGAQFIESGLIVQQVFDPVIVSSQYEEIEKEVVLFPNPANDVLLVQLPLPAGMNMFMQIFDVTGHRVLEKTTESEVVLQKLDVSALPQGMYFLQVVSNGRVTSMNKFAKL